jgi:hypothetical protein
MSNEITLGTRELQRIISCVGADSEGRVTADQCEVDFRIILWWEQERRKAQARETCDESEEVSDDVRP